MTTLRINFWQLLADTRLSSVSLFVLALFVSSCGMQFEAWDTDDSGYIEPLEFEANLADKNYFDKWDGNSNGFLSQEEAYNAVFVAMDSDENDRLTYEEWAVMREYYQENIDQEFGEWSSWDADENEFVTQAEFRAGLEGNRMFSEWDLDGDYLVSNDEFKVGLFNAWDQSNDERIDRTEFNDLGVGLKPGS